MRALVRAGLISSGFLSASAALAAYPDCPTTTPPSGAELTAWRAGAVAEKAARRQTS